MTICPHPFSQLPSIDSFYPHAGMKYLSENLMWHISSQVGELKKIVQQNRETLSEIRESFDKPEVMKELIR